MSFGIYGERRSIPAHPELTVQETPGKKLKHVFGAHDTGVEHVWANPMGKDGTGYAQTHGTNPQRNLYFKTSDDGTRVLYSYHDWYPIGAMFKVGKQTVYLVRGGKPYSNTTACHMSTARNAANRSNGAQVFIVSDVTVHTSLGHNSNGLRPDIHTHTGNLAAMVQEYTETVASYKKARAAYMLESIPRRCTDQAFQIKAYAKLFKLKLPKLPPAPQTDTGRLKAAKEREEYRRTHRSEIEEKRRAAEVQRNQETLAKWKAGADVHPGYAGQYAYLRVRHIDREEGEYFVETSQHASVPVLGHTGAARLLAFLTACKDAGREYQRNGHAEHIGNFTVESFKPAVLTTDQRGEREWVIVAGCHRILWSEVLTIADEVSRVAGRVGV